MKHEPVLLNEVVDMLNCKPGKNYVDCTVGMGGHAEAILERIGKGKLIGIDCDDTAIRMAGESLKRFGDRFIPVHDNFTNIEAIFKKLNIGFVDGILLDLGISLHQLDEPSRGFSFMKDGPLDMRMDRSREETAGEFVNQLSEKELAELLKNFGEERAARRIAKRIVKFRAREPVRTTKELADIIRGVFRERRRINPATKTFQALRIAVNRELEALESTLEKASCLLSIGGRICIISYHSLEDRIVKREFLRLSKGTSGEGPVSEVQDPESRSGKTSRARLLILTKKPLVPSRAEVLMNRRSRSAKMRAAERIE
jgi:16S rRNA (cytosine1402-N4)-methyltransferase